MVIGGKPWNNCFHAQQKLIGISCFKVIFLKSPLSKLNLFIIIVHVVLIYLNYHF